MKNCCMGHLKTEALVKALGLRKYEAIGILECLFQFAQSSAKEGNIGKYSNLQIALAMGWVDGDVDKGLDDADRLIDALLTCGFLDNDPDHRLIIHDWEEHAPNYVKDNLRKKRSRAKSKSVTDSPVLSESVRDCPEESSAVSINLPNQPNQPNQDVFFVFKNAWNERAKTQWPHMSSCNKLSDARKQIIQDYIDADSTWLEQAVKAIAKLPLPMNADGRHKANVNWFLKPDMVLQINEGFGQWGKDYKPPPIKKRETPEQRQTRAEASALHQMIQEHRKAGNGTSDECEALKRRLEEVEKVYS